MPEYSFKCEKCKEAFSVFLSLNEYDEKINNIKCNHCKSKNIIRDYETDNVTANYIKGLHECKTLGEYADKQTKKYGQYKCEDMLSNLKTKKNPNTGMKELPSGMSRAKNDGDLPRITKDQAKKKRGMK